MSNNQSSICKHSKEKIWKLGKDGHLQSATKEMEYQKFKCLPPKFIHFHWMKNPIKKRSKGFARHLKESESEHEFLFLILKLNGRVWRQNSYNSTDLT